MFIAEAVSSTPRLFFPVCADVVPGGPGGVRRFFRAVQIEGVALVSLKSHQIAGWNVSQGRAGALDSRGCRRLLIDTG